MTNPTKADIIAVFTPKPNSDLVDNFIDARLEEMAELQMGERYQFCHVADIEICGDEAEGQIVERSHCSCCGDDYHGYVSLTMDELVELLDDPDLIKRKIQAQKDEETRKEAERKAERERQSTEREKAEYQRLKRKFG